MPRAQQSIWSVKTVTTALCLNQDRSAVANGGAED
jgi:hypothetical protein